MHLNLIFLAVLFVVLVFVLYWVIHYIMKGTLEGSFSDFQFWYFLIALVIALVIAFIVWYFFMNDHMMYYRSSYERPRDVVVVETPSRSPSRDRMTYERRSAVVVSSPMSDTTSTTSEDVM